MAIMTRHSTTHMRRITACFTAVAATMGSAIALAPQAAASGHETVGGGTYRVSNSDSPCTEFKAGLQWYTSCPGSWVTVSSGVSYIAVPLSAHSWVACETYAPGGLLFEHNVENLADVPGNQRFWAEHGWGPYTPEALCQLW